MKRHPWFALVIGFALGLSVGLLARIPALTPADNLDRYLETRDRQEATGPPYQVYLQTLILAEMAPGRVDRSKLERTRLRAYDSARGRVAADKLAALEDRYAEVIDRTPRR
jgi:hypothetical protein